MAIVPAAQLARRPAQISASWDARGCSSGVSAGNMDSMVNHYTANKRLRSDDAYTAGGQAGFRPDYAATVYTRILKRLFPDTPVVLGGIEASLRRLTHYDYWSDSLKPSILIDSGADPAGLRHGRPGDAGNRPSRAQRFQHASAQEAASSRFRGRPEICRLAGRRAAEALPVRAMPERQARLRENFRPHRKPSRTAWKPARSSKRRRAVS